MNELQLFVRLLLVWAATLTTFAAFAGIWAYGLEDRIRRKIAKDIKEALEVERLLGE